MRALIIFFFLIAIQGFAQEVKKMDGYENGVHHVSFSPDGQWLLTGSGVTTNKAEIRDAKTGEVKITLQGIENSVAKGGWFPSGDYLYTSSGMGFKVQVWTKEGVLVKTIEDSACEYTSEMAFDPTSEGFVISCDSRLLYFSKDYEQTGELATPEIFETFTFSQNGTLYVGSAFESLQIYKEQDESWQTIELPLGPRHIEEITSGEMMLTDYYVMRSDEPFVRFFKNGEETKSFTFDEKVLSAKWIPNKELIIASFSGGKIRVVDPDGKIIKEVGRFGSFPLSLAVNPNGENAAVGYLGALVLIDLSEF